MPSTYPCSMYNQVPTPHTTPTPPWYPPTGIFHALHELLDELVWHHLVYVIIELERVVEYDVDCRQERPYFIVVNQHICIYDIHYYSKMLIEKVLIYRLYLSVCGETMVCTQLYNTYAQGRSSPDP